MDLVILHVLEDFREGPGAFLGKFMLQMTSLGELDTVIALLAAIYWCVSKKIGTYLLLGFNWCRLVNGLAKITACAYRPWIRDSSIIPDKIALVTATGYSFPSGHSTNAAALFGGLGINTDLAKPLRIICLAVMVMIGFSRLYLCVHTPQDVVVGILLGCLTMYGAYKLLPLILSNKNWDLYVAAASVIVSLISVIFATLKSYPVDYDANGKILVDGAKMAKDTFKGVGWNIGFFAGWIIERRYVNFSSDNSLSYRLFNLICGILGLWMLNTLLIPVLHNMFHGNLGVVIGCSLQMLYIVLIYPMIIKKICNNNRI